MNKEEIEQSVDGQYITTYDDKVKMFTRVDATTGESWAWEARKKPTKTSHTAKNGMTVTKLQTAGNSVRVKHLRWAVYLPQVQTIFKRSNECRAIVVPSTFRCDPMYKFLPKGGYTHIVIKSKSGKYICVSSECSDEDSFCYAAGVASALDRLSRLDIKFLGVEE